MEAGTGDPAWMILQAQQLLEAGANEIMIESEGITESVRTWRADLPARVVASLGLDKVLFEAAEPEVGDATDIDRARAARVALRHGTGQERLDIEAHSHL
jgi:hypothetical protein